LAQLAEKPRDNLATLVRTVLYSSKPDHTLNQNNTGIKIQHGGNIRKHPELKTLFRDFIFVFLITLMQFCVMIEMNLTILYTKYHRYNGKVEFLCECGSEKLE
jgi:hypothetical protein